MHVELTYCSQWGYEPEALSLTGKLLTAYKQKITDLKLIPAGGGAFELTVNGELVYSKLATGEFPNADAMTEAVGARLKKKK